MAAISCSPLPHIPGARASRPVRPARPPDRHHPSLAVRRRRTASALVVLAALGILSGVGSLAGAGQDPPGGDGSGARVETAPILATTYLVQPGDTLWSVARRLQPEGDVRPLVARLDAGHGRRPLVPGERLRLAV